ncbi:hypothetical protein T4E_9723 [Trichinella pseudospiralis]|uniref:Uncharacterized protein n=1 Tax=Trichinella pseudospiralis TaxID=6337 RepID=A0A0V0YI12_TRIPS|nr:hypothetical protein T4E_9723 [Trichinella pseudospiralis]
MRLTLTQWICSPFSEVDCKFLCHSFSSFHLYTSSRHNWPRRRSAFAFLSRALSDAPYTLTVYPYTSTVWH